MLQPPIRFRDHTTFRHPYPAETLQRAWVRLQRSPLTATVDHLAVCLVAEGVGCPHAAKRLARTLLMEAKAQGKAAWNGKQRAWVIIA